MKIEFTTGVAGARFAYEPGDRVELDDKVAQEFVRKKQAFVLRRNASLVRAERPESMVRAAPEHAVSR